MNKYIPGKKCFHKLNNFLVTKAGREREKKKNLWLIEIETAGDIFFAI